MGQKFIAGILAVRSKFQNVLCTVSLCHFFRDLCTCLVFLSGRLLRRPVVELSVKCFRLVNQVNCQLSNVS
jgi:hypothetical protein